MYKTVRQGENSLQYTILPQTEEVLTNSGVKGKGRDYSPSTQARRVNRCFFLYYLAVFLFGLLLIFGAVLVVLCLTGIVPVDLPSRLAKTNFIQKWSEPIPRRFISSSSDKIQVDKKLDIKSLNETTTQNIPTLSPYNTTQDTQTTHTSVDIVSSVSLPVLNSTTSQTSTSKQEWIMPALKRLQSSTLAPIVTTEKTDSTTVKVADKLSSLFPTHQRESNNDLMLGHDQINWTDYDDEDDEDYDITKPVTTATSNTKKPPLIINKSLSMKIKSTKQPSVATTPPTLPVYSSASTTNNTAGILDIINKKILGKDKNKTKVYTKFMETKERILDDDDEDYKEPCEEDEASATGASSGSDDVKMSQTKSSWLQTRWPFVDTSSYFQWTDYSARDNLLLPAILSAAVSALLVLAVLCYALRRRQRCKRRIQEIGNLTSDLQAEDNAILLTAENPSEDD